MLFKELLKISDKYNEIRKNQKENNKKFVIYQKNILELKTFIFVFFLFFTFFSIDKFLFYPLIDVHYLSTINELGFSSLFEAIKREHAEIFVKEIPVLFILFYIKIFITSFFSVFSLFYIDFILKLKITRKIKKQKKKMIKSFILSSFCCSFVFCFFSILLSPGIGLIFNYFSSFVIFVTLISSFIFLLKKAFFYIKIKKWSNLHFIVSTNKISDSKIKLGKIKNEIIKDKESMLFLIACIHDKDLYDNNVKNKYNNPISLEHLIAIYDKSIEGQKKKSKKDIATEKYLEQNFKKESFIFNE